MESRIEKVMRSVFGISGSQKIDLDSSPESISGWDSLRHIQLVVSLEEEFDVQFTDGELTDLISIRKIKGILEQKD
tara:strand:+ start:521 stop:748 length:228 start_codon:yes stop_codon:yes gene_type:complete